MRNKLILLPLEPVTVLRKMESERDEEVEQLRRRVQHLEGILVQNGLDPKQVQEMKAADDKGVVTTNDVLVQKEKNENPFAEKVFATCKASPPESLVLPAAESDVAEEKKDDDNKEEVFLPSPPNGTTPSSEESSPSAAPKEEEKPSQEEATTSPSKEEQSESPKSDEAEQPTKEATKEQPTKEQAPPESLVLPAVSDVAEEKKDDDNKEEVLLPSPPNGTTPSSEEASPSAAPKEEEKPSKEEAATSPSKEEQSESPKSEEAEQPTKEATKEQPTKEQEDYHPPGTKAGGTWYKQTLSHKGADNTESFTSFAWCCLSPNEDYLNSQIALDEKFVYFDSTGTKEYYSELGKAIHGVYTPGRTLTEVPADFMKQRKLQSQSLNTDEALAPPGLSEGGLWYRQHIPGRGKRMIYRQTSCGMEFYDKRGLKVNLFDGPVEPPVSMASMLYSRTSLVNDVSNKSID